MIMCTLTWWQEHASYGIFFNRDESRRRCEAEGPAVRQERGVSYISPIDPEGGGTWVWVNETGLIGAVLNHYRDATGPVAAPVSRGRLLLSLAPHRCVASLAAAVKAADCRRYRGFLLFAWDGSAMVLFGWDGAVLRQDTGAEISAPLTTSGYRPDEVTAHRRARYRHLVGTGYEARRERLAVFHDDHDPARPAHSVLMVRPDARTVSQSRITVDPSAVIFSYAAVAGDRRPGPAAVTTIGRG